MDVRSKPVTSWSVFILLKSIDGKILLVYNKAEKKLDGKTKTEGWGLPGGGLENSEIKNGIINLKAALKRELKEETGINLDDVEIVYDRESFYYEDKRDWIKKYGISRVIILTGQIKKEVELKPSPNSDVLRTQWFTIDEIKKLYPIYKSHLRRICILEKK